MLKDEIQKKIYECKTDEDIKNFLEQRLTELEENTPEVTVGQGYTDSFNEFISKKYIINLPIDLVEKSVLI